MKYDSIAVLIPAYKPDRRLNKLVDDLREAGFINVVVVDDGGGEPFADIFADLRGKATVLTHPVNRGKGAALKTGLTEIMKTPGVGVVTADADGQHTPADVAKIADALLENPNTLIMGSRDKKAMPPRSKAGNTLTCGVFGLLTGLWISDTQTGLRGLPASALKRLSSAHRTHFCVRSARSAWLNRYGAWMSCWLPIQKPDPGSIAPRTGAASRMKRSSSRTK